MGYVELTELAKIRKVIKNRVYLTSAAIGFERFAREIFLLLYLRRNLRLPFSTTLALFDSFSEKDCRVYHERVLEQVQEQYRLSRDNSLGSSTCWPQFVIRRLRNPNGSRFLPV